MAIAHGRDAEGGLTHAGSAEMSVDLFQKLCG